ncbi:MAG TPA: PHP domain-containing protein [Actinomycetota bacterium]|nr:PHP domain-containing protein [Actinomycetota bacterium]
MKLDNAGISELLARAAEQAEGHRQRAYLKASREAMAWPVEASDVLGAGLPLTKLTGIGPHLALRLEEWISDPPADLCPPEIRSGFLTMAQALGTVREHPDWRQELRGDLQMHTTYSDGVLSVLDMAREASDYGGYAFVAITDHSGGQRIPSGMDAEAIAAQRREIDAANEQLELTGIRILRGIEMNLTPQGEGDTDPDILREMDIVLGSFHSQLRGTHDQTDRYLAALSNPDIQVLAHPRGRMYDRRAGLHADWPKVFEFAASRGKALEIDANPNRQDLQIGLLELAREAGVTISIGTDAHSAYELQFMSYGLAAAIRAGIPRERILNFRTANQVREWVESVRER